MNEPKNTDNNGRFKPGNPGRPAGTPNHLTKTVKETVLSVFNEIQDDPKVKLSQFARDYPRDFYAIAAKLIPTDIKADVSVAVQVEQITGMVIKKTDGIAV